MGARHARLILVGECPGRDSIAHRPSLALTGSSGRNICAIAGWRWLDYLAYTERRNLFYDPQPQWSARQAAVEAMLLLPEIVRGVPVLFLGAKVAAAVGIESAPDFEWLDLSSTTRMARVPHPSGRNRVWNDRRVREAAREFLGDLLVTDNLSRPPVTVAP